MRLGWEVLQVVPQYLHGFDVRLGLQVFVPQQLAQVPLQAAACMLVVSEDLLLEPRVIEQVHSGEATQHKQRLAGRACTCARSSRMNRRTVIPWCLSPAAHCAVGIGYRV